MRSVLRVGQILKGAVNTYSITKQIHSCVFLALDSTYRKVIVKTAYGHWRLQNEAEVLQRFQTKTSALRPMIEELRDSDPPSIVLQQLDSDLMIESRKKRLTRHEIKRVAKVVLEGLRVLHEEDFVHTDVKLDNVLVNYGRDTRFHDVKLGDCGGAVPADSKWAREGYTVGAPIWRSPEILLGLPWGIPTDIWSFGTMIISLIYAEDWHIFNPSNDGVSFDDDEFEFTILKKHHQFFGPFPTTFSDFADADAIKIIIHAMDNVPKERRNPFKYITEREMVKEDNVFLQKIMKLDPRDRPSARELLDDIWFAEAL